MKHIELEQFLHAFTSRGFDSVSWAFLLTIVIEWPLYSNESWKMSCGKCMPLLATDQCWSVELLIAIFWWQLKTSWNHVVSTVESGWCFSLFHCTLWYFSNTGTDAMHFNVWRWVLIDVNSCNTACLFSVIGTISATFTDVFNCKQSTLQSVHLMASNNLQLFIELNVPGLIWLVVIDFICDILNYSTCVYRLHGWACRFLLLAGCTIAPCTLVSIVY